MPANLTPQYIKAEKEFKAAKTIEEKIACMENMLALIPKHKGTDHMQADLKHRLAQLRREQLEGRANGQAGGAGLQDREGRRRPGDPARRAERRQVAVAQVAHQRRRRRGRIPVHDAGPAAGHGALRGHPDPARGHARRHGGLFRGRGCRTSSAAPTPRCSSPTSPTTACSTRWTSSSAGWKR